MTLYINAILDDKFKVSLIEKGSETALFGEGKLWEGGRLLVLIDKLLKDNKVKWSQINTIRVADSGGSFTSLRVGVLCANALAYAHGKALVGDSGQETIKLEGYELLSPIYSSEPNIGIIKKNIKV